MAGTKKEAILETALNLFVKNGIDATSIRAIAEGADTAEGNIYRHFKSKNDLAREIFLDCANQFRAAFENAVKDVDKPEEQLKALVHTIFNFSIHKKLEFAYILVVNHREEIITKEILSKPLPKDVFIEILNSGIKKGVFRPIDPSIAVAWIVGMVQRSFTFIQRGMTPLSQEEVVEQTVDAAYRMIKS